MDMGDSTCQTLGAFVEKSWDDTSPYNLAILNLKEHDIANHFIGFHTYRQS
jgi:hypothetical protein